MENIKNIKKKDPKLLAKPLCMDNPEIQAAEYHNHYIDGVTYRVWSAFEGKTKAEKSLGPLCMDNPEIQAAEYHDHYIDGVTYRVWSAFEGKTEAVKSLGELMLRKLESGEDVEEVVDEHELEIQRINEETCKFFDDDTDMSEEEIMLLNL